MREWTCSECGARHDRDVNAARNILVAGHRHPSDYVRERFIATFRAGTLS